MRFLLGLIACVVCQIAWAAEPFQFRPNERVVFIGNTFAERLQWHGYFEAMLAARLPEHNLTFRNLGFSGDEAMRGTLGTPAGPGTAGKHEENAFLQLRALNFGDIFSYIERQRADVVIACYGMNESFSETTNLAKFSRDIKEFLTKILDLKCSINKTSPRLILVSPIPHEDLGGDLPSPKSHNDALAQYTDAMSKVARDLGIPFLDLFTPMTGLLQEKEASPLTFNGIHLNAYGNWVAANIMLSQLNLSITNNYLFSIAPPVKSKIHKGMANFVPKVSAKMEGPGRYQLRMNGKPVYTATAEEWADGVKVQLVSLDADALLASVNDKNWHFFMLYRAVNGEYIYGRRKEPFGVVSFPPEFQLLEKMTNEKDASVQQLARKAASTKIEFVKAE